MSYQKLRAASLARSPTDLRPLLGGGVRNQGTRPLCIPFALGTAHEAARSQRMGLVEELAVEPLWSHCIQRGKTGPEGTLLVDVGDALSDMGQVHEGTWPYNDSLADQTEPAPPEASFAHWFTAGLEMLPLLHDGIESLVEDALEAQIAVVLILEISDEFDWPAAGGEIDVPPLKSPTNAYHAVVAVGAATNDRGDTRRLLIRNSWGAGWGAGGFGWLPLDYLIGFCPQAAVIDPSSLS